MIGDPALHRRRPLRPWTRTWSLILAGLAANGWAAEAIIPAVTTAPPATGDELDLFKDLPVVVSASRHTTPLTATAVPVSVLSGDDLHFGGHSSVPEVLQFVPGVDVLRADRNVSAVGVRGFHGSFSDRTLTLINGRNADSPIFGGSEFYRLPLLLADVDHIEVVRGPGGAAWGANAYNGVINIILKEPEDMLGVYGTTTVTGFGDTASQARWCGSSDAWSWRVGIGYEQHVSSREALDTDAFRGSDWGNKGVTDNSVVFRPNDATTVRAGLGFARYRAADFELLGYESPDDTALNTTRAYTRLDQALSRTAAYQLGWYGNFADSRRPALLHDHTNENAAEAQLDLKDLAGHRLSLGGELRFVDISVVDSGTTDTFTLGNETYHERRAGLYAIDQWQLAERFVVESQLRGDAYSGTSNDWSGRLALLSTLDREHRQVVRVAAAKAYRTPLPILRDGQVSRPTFGNPGLVTQVIPSDDLHNEETWSLEGGYSVQFATDLLLRTDVYYQRYEDLIGYRTVILPGILPGAPTFIRNQADNIDGATGTGAEVEVAWTPALPWTSTHSRCSLWYAYNHLKTDLVGQEIRAWTPSEHKVGGTCRVFLPENLVLNLNYRFSSSVDDPDRNTPTHAGPIHVLDLALAWRFMRGRGEVMIGAWDVFNTTNEPVQGSGSFSSHETPGRTFFIRGEYSF